MAKSVLGVFHTELKECAKRTNTTKKQGRNILQEEIQRKYREYLLDGLPENISLASAAGDI